MDLVVQARTVGTINGTAPGVRLERLPRPSAAGRQRLGVFNAIEDVP
jgi:hypothetical protein